MCPKSSTMFLKAVFCVIVSAPRTDGLHVKYSNMFQAFGLSISSSTDAVRGFKKYWV